jgi:plasmid stabilization system protein ParE
MDLLREFPLIGHEGLLSGTREIAVPGLPYVIVHRIEREDEESLVILGVYHGAQDRTRG